MGLPEATLSAPDRIESSTVSIVARCTPSSSMTADRVLCYHEVAEGEHTDRYSVTRRQFSDHIDFIASRNQSLARAGNPHRLIVTFDDNIRSHAAIATPILAEAGVEGIFFLNPSLIGEDAELAMPDVRSMIDAGMTIGVHNDTHTVASQMTFEEFSAAAHRCADFCDELEQPRRWAYPGGFLGSFTSEQDRLLQDLGFSRYSTVEGDADGSDDAPQARYVIRRYTSLGQLEAIAHGKMRSLGAVKRLRFRLQQRS